MRGTMTNSSAHSLRAQERRSAERFPCGSVTFCRVTDVLDQAVMEAGAWDISAGGTCLVLEANYPPGARLEAEFSTSTGEPALLVWLRVEHSDIYCPGSRAMWLTGCSFQSEVPAAELRPFVSRARTQLPHDGPAP